ncbi:MAG TPA: carboxypeptidase regulatory-like domain-containing protein, partial [Bacteroidales bacterium]|nr:carboxypeptidase regulatory-like domain-containing protein [Bacteroidales bacterium]
MKTNILLLILLAVSLTSHAQTTVSGRILSQEDRQPLISSTVSVFKADLPELVTGTITNEQGRFSVSGLQAGEYDFVI